MAKLSRARRTNPTTSNAIAKRTDFLDSTPPEKYPTSNERPKPDKTAQGSKNSYISNTKLAEPNITSI